MALRAITHELTRVLQSFEQTSHAVERRFQVQSHPANLSSKRHATNALYEPTRLLATISTKIKI
jgi:hypothetical protein